METLLKELSDKIEVNLTEEQISKFITYKELLKDWNQKINLTAITEDREIVLKHFVDSLTVLKYIPSKYKEMTPNGAYYVQVKEADLVDIDVATGKVKVKNVRNYSWDGLSYNRPDYYEDQIIIL